MKSENNCPSGKPKWSAGVNDRIIPMPGKIITESILRKQAEVEDDCLIVRDHNSPDDQVMKPGQEIDLSMGNVFYTEKTCDVESRSNSTCKSPPKLGLFVDDKLEIVISPNQSTESVLELFGLKNVELVRDHESPNDEVLSPGTKLNFADGPVFVTKKCQCDLEIIVNRKRFGSKDGVQQKMTGEKIARLITDQPAKTDVYKITGGRRKIELAEEIHVQNCDEFEVIRRDVSGGYNQDRIVQELTRFRDGGGQIELLAEVPAVVYKAVPSHGGTASTDVLVSIPGHYPSQMLDCAFLPSDCPYLDSALGAKQEPLQAGGRSWIKKSYHPHNGGGGPPWNPAVHGIHTYYDELLPWLMRA